jgi:hypothetical protein
MGAALVLAPATAANAQLIEVEVERVLNNNTVVAVVPIQAAANICDTTVALLAEDLEDGETTCTARNNQPVTVRTVPVQ